jgi:hypothetical protein
MYGHSEGLVGQVVSQASLDDGGLWSEAGLAFEASSASIDFQQQQQQQQQEGEVADAEWVPREQHDKLKRKLETAKVCPS